jgi:hypothetical protein
MRIQIQMADLILLLSSVMAAVDPALMLALSVSPTSTIYGHSAHHSPVTMPPPPRGAGIPFSLPTPAPLFSGTTTEHPAGMSTPSDDDESAGRCRAQCSEAADGDTSRQGGRPAAGWSSRSGMAAGPLGVGSRGADAGDGPAPTGSGCDPSTGGNSRRLTAAHLGPRAALAWTPPSPAAARSALV